MMNQPRNPAAEEGRERLLSAFPVPEPSAWRAEVERLLGGVPFDRAMLTRTLEGIVPPPMGTAADTADLPWPDHAPGEAPFLRGATAAGHAGEPWLVAQELPLPTAAEFNEALRNDLARGQTAVSLRLDLAGCLGLDPDQADPAAVGRGGTSLAGISELERALDGVDPDVPLHVTAGSSALPLVAMLAALLRRRGEDPSRLVGCVGCDPVYGLASLGRLPLSLRRLEDERAVLTRWALRRAPRLRTLPVHETPWHEGGADSVLSLALTLSSAVHSLRAMEQRGLAPEKAVGRMVFRVSVASDFFMEIAKLRALRLLWSDVQAAAGLTPRPAVIHARTSRRTQTRHDPHVNMLRATTQAMSAVLGGVQALHVAPFDEVDSLPDAFGRRIARNVQLLLRHESRLDRVADPAGGAWAVERLTADLARAAWSRFQEIEQAGGVVAGLRRGRVQERVAACAEVRRERLARRREVLVGTNRYADPDEPPRTPRRVDHAALQARRAAEVVALRTGETDHAGVMEELGRLLESDAAALFAHMESAASCGATLGELVSILRHDDTPDEPVAAIPLRRDAEPFEALRARFAALGPSRRVYCACLGERARTMARLDFTRGFFQVGGCDVAGDAFHDDPAAAVAAARADGAPTVVLVALDEVYAAQAEILARSLGQGPRPPVVLLAGRPGSREDAWRAAGIDGFVHAGSDVLAVLGDLADRLEVQQ